MKQSSSNEAWDLFSPPHPPWNPYLRKASGKDDMAKTGKFAGYNVAEARVAARYVVVAGHEEERTAGSSVHLSWLIKGV